MKKIDIKQEGQSLLKHHAFLYEFLIKIPETREIIFIEDTENRKKIGKPRFKRSKYHWSVELLKFLRDHLQNIWNFLYKYSYWFDETIYPLIAYENRRISKKSIIFLLEEDVWSTDEVYGNYLIEKSKEETIISYFRRRKKIKQFKLPSTNDNEIKRWICNNAVKQIQDQFDFLWLKLKTEIETCIEETYHREPKLILTTEYLRDQLRRTKDISDDWSEAALLSLGRIIELWLLKLLGKEEKKIYHDEDIIRSAEIEGIINKHEVRLLNKIRREYNNLKHKLYYKIKKNIVVDLIEDFSNLFLNG